MIAVIPSIILGRREIWGYTRLANVFAPITLFVLFSPYIFPLAVLIRLTTESPREIWSIAALPLSVAVSFVQLVALLPLFQ
jgi:hypothetical protein